ncbi:MAG: acetylxylan esterase [Pseudomonadota bacterium]
MGIKAQSSRCLSGLAVSAALIMPLAQAAAPAPPASSNAGDFPPVVRLTNAEDHDRLARLLGVTDMRRGADGQVAQANSGFFAPYDESRANDYRNLGNPLVTNNGRKVKTPEMWWKVRRRELVELFDREIYGRMPSVTPKVTWEVTSVTAGTTGNVATVIKQIVGHVDNSAYPLIEVNIQLSLTVPANAIGPVPVMMVFGGGGFGGGAARAGGGMSTAEQILVRGWGYATLNPGSIQADNGAGLTSGIIGLVNHGQPRKPDDWGALRAWAWGVSRAIDYFETDPTVDAKQVGLEGHSRYGKGTIVAMAYEPRLAIAYPSSSGAGGAHINRRRWGEKIENVGGASEYHWMAGNFIKYTGTVNGVVMGPDDMPVDGHELVALCAPRPVFIGGGIQQNDAWQDPRGMFLAGALASPVYELLGHHGTGIMVDGKFKPVMEYPTPMTAILDGDVAYRTHEQGHTDGPNWPYFLQFASRYLHLPATPPPGLHQVPSALGVDWEYTRPPSPVPPAPRDP